MYSQFVIHGQKNIKLCLKKIYVVAYLLVFGAKVKCGELVRGEELIMHHPGVWLTNFKTQIFSVPPGKRRHCVSNDGTSVFLHTLGNSWFFTPSLTAKTSQITGLKRTILWRLRSSKVLRSE